MAEKDIDLLRRTKRNRQADHSSPVHKLTHDQLVYVVAGAAQPSNSSGTSTGPPDCASALCVHCHYIVTPPAV